MKLTLKIMGKTIGERVESLHRDAQHLTETGEILPRWKDKNIFSYSYRKYTRFIHNEFRRLFKYFKNAPVFEDEETRNIVLSKLEDLEDKFCTPFFYEQNVKINNSTVNT